MRSFYLTLSFLFLSVLSNAQTPCVNGFAAGYPCKNVDLMARISADQLGGDQINGGFLNDIWGWTDPLDQKEYALVGLVNGTAFVDVSNPSAPIYLGILLEHNSLPKPAVRSRGINHLEAKSIWRDIKVYKDHAFVVSEDTLHGMQVFDLTQLRDRSQVPRNFAETAHYGLISNSHNLVINEETGFAYSVGGNDTDMICDEGGLHIIDVRDPTNPTYAGCYDDGGYTHDAQVVIYKGTDSDYIGKEIAFSSNESVFNITDVTNKTSPVNIAIQSYDSVSYMHQGWLTEDHQYFISNDETDEWEFGVNTRTLMWDVRDLDNPVHIGTYVSDFEAFDHNLYVHNGYAYQSNYTSGLRILNSINIQDTMLSEAAYFDTYLDNDRAEYDGSWSNYPFFKSGIVIVSDIQNGLFILRPNLGFDIAQQPESVVECNEVSNALLSIQTNDMTHSYQWQRNQGQGFINLQNDMEFSGVKTSQLDISIQDSSIVKDAFRCVITDINNRFVISDTVSVSIEPFVEVSFELEIQDQTVILENTSTKQGDLVWDLGDGNTVLDRQSLMYTYDSGQNYDIELSISNRCGTDTSVKRVDVFTNILKRNELRELSVFPNPTSGLLTVQLPKQSSDMSIRVMDQLGREMFPQSTEQKFSKVILDVSNLETGMYYLELSNGSLPYSSARFNVE